MTDKKQTSGGNPFSSFFSSKPSVPSQPSNSSNKNKYAEPLPVTNSKTPNNTDSTTIDGNTSAIIDGKTINGRHFEGNVNDFVWNAKNNQQTTEKSTVLTSNLAVNNLTANNAIKRKNMLIPDIVNHFNDVSKKLSANFKSLKIGINSDFNVKYHIVVDVFNYEDYCNKFTNNKYTFTLKDTLNKKSVTLIVSDNTLNEPTELLKYYIAHDNYTYRNDIILGRFVGIKTQTDIINKGYMYNNKTTDTVCFFINEKNIDQPIITDIKMSELQNLSSLFKSSVFSKIKYVKDRMTGTEPTFYNASKKIHNRQVFMYYSYPSNFIITNKLIPQCLSTCGNKCYIGENDQEQNKTMPCDFVGGGNRTHTNKRKNTRRGNKSMKGGAARELVIYDKEDFGPYTQEESNKLEQIEKTYKDTLSEVETSNNTPFNKDLKKQTAENIRIININSLNETKKRISDSKKLREQLEKDAKEKLEISRKKNEEDDMNFKKRMEEKNVINQQKANDFKKKFDEEMEEYRKGVADKEAERIKAYNAHPDREKERKLGEELKKTHDFVNSDKYKAETQKYQNWVDNPKSYREIINEIAEERRNYKKEQMEQRNKAKIMRSQSTNDINKPNTPSLFGRLTSNWSQSPNNTNTPVNSNPPPPKRYGWWGGTRPHTKKHPLKKHTNTRKNHRH